MKRIARKILRISFADIMNNSLVEASCKKILAEVFLASLYYCFNIGGIVENS